MTPHLSDGRGPPLSPPSLSSSLTSNPPLSLSLSPFSAMAKPQFLTLTPLISLCCILLPLSQCQIKGDTSSYNFSNPALLPLLTDLVYNRISNLTLSIGDEISNQSSFCVKDRDADWNKAFNFSSNLEFVTSCIQRTQGDMTRRLCTSAEVKFYFSSFFERGADTSYLRPNKNCNLTSWISGCEPGWACSVGSDQDVNIKNSKEMPHRVLSCEPCCAGFFCPHGITCMIPCPLGSYCPLAELNRNTGVCEPYLYQLPLGQPNHSCGGANVWADVRSSGEMFCSAGSYCPTTTEENSCSRGHYCRMGSTTESGCFKLASCNPMTSNQNIHAYGIMLIAGLSTLLLIIYNCSDQVITTRERRQAKTRTAAAISARETIRARERWKAAKDAAKKHVSGLQTHFSGRLQSFSGRFSRKSSIARTDEMTILDRDKPISDESPFRASSYPSTSSTTWKERKNDPVDLMKMMHALENDVDSNEGFDINIKKETHKEKKAQTRSQIFRYAYAQLEKEKAIQEQNKNLTFSGVIAMANDIEIRKRPVIEVSFKDLSLTLKGKNKKLLRYVTGKIKAGHITAVMGPSGAGKTTFLSALAGKAAGCTISGLILVNGKAESIHSYKKIIGFVPQDDIVHGNLTVAENLWFSARCRLSADLPEPDKVLVVERVIEALGLQSVRDSLVGTVEKRGISGGQRKRVNVGLEMVMEPSLLILDEPTSGLDSSSSQLLLRALRREALEGVNICMVVHQPSYTLFNMFDDLILLAKGGLIAYHGPVKTVEDYFAGHGINVPDRVNPPDHFIDILEGIVKPSANSDVSHNNLPLLWMIHKGYQIPHDMQQNAVGPTMPPVGVNTEDQTHLGHDITEERSFAVELWQDVRCNVELHRDKIRHNFLRSKDLSRRRTPGVFRQYKYFLGRIGKQRLRESRIQAIDYMILLLAGACLGSLTKASDENFGAVGYTYTIIAVSLLCKIAALRTFSLDKLQYWRERASGISSLAHFLSKDTIDSFNTAIKPVVYLSMFYFFNNPRSSFAENYVVLVCLVYCVTGIAYILAIALEPGPAQLWSVLLPVVLTLIATQQNNGEIVKKIASLCYPKWALEAFVIANAERYYGVWMITRCGSLLKAGYDLHNWGLCIFLLVIAGVFSRIVAFVCMMVFQKK